MKSGVRDNLIFYIISGVFFFFIVLAIFILLIHKDNLPTKATQQINAIQQQEKSIITNIGEKINNNTLTSAEGNTAVENLYNESITLENMIENVNDNGTTPTNRLAEAKLLENITMESTTIQDYLLKI